MIHVTKPLQAIAHGPNGRMVRQVQGAFAHTETGTCKPASIRRSPDGRDSAVFGVSCETLNSGDSAVLPTAGTWKLQPRRSIAQASSVLERDDPCNEHYRVIPRLGLSLRFRCFEVASKEIGLAAEAHVRRFRIRKGLADMMRLMQSCVPHASSSH